MNDEWLWIWLGIAIAFAFLELVTPLLFFMVSFAVGGAVAAVGALLDVGVAWQWGLFLAGSAAALGTLVPIGRRMALASPAGDPELWDQSSFYARTMLMRSLERGELLGWVLQRDALAEQDPIRAERLRQISSYWDDARPNLSHAFEELYKAGGMDPHTAPSRNAGLESPSDVDHPACDARRTPPSFCADRGTRVSRRCARSFR